jgi:hypothetical protein
MTEDLMVAALASRVPVNLARDLIREFLQIREDVATGTLGRSAPGKFVETTVQILQYLEGKPNVLDLRLLLAAAQWVLAELVRNIVGGSMDEAGLLIARIQSPVESVIEDIGGTRLVHADLTVREELLVLLHSAYPERVTRQAMCQSLRRRRSDTVGKVVMALWRDKAVEGDSVKGYVLTRPGYRQAKEVVLRINEYDGAA